MRPRLVQIVGHISNVSDSVFSYAKGMHRTSICADGIVQNAGRLILQYVGQLPRIEH